MKAQDIRFETARTLVLENAVHVEKVSTNCTPVIVWGFCIPNAEDNLITGAIIESFQILSGPASKRGAFYNCYDFIRAIDEGRITINEKEEE